MFLGGSFLVIGAGFPLDAFDFQPVREEAPILQAARVLPPDLEALIAAPRVAEAPPSLPSPLLIERTREQFFRAEVPYGEIIYREAKKNGLSPELVAAVVETESDFRPLLVSNKSAYGLMQVLPSTGVLMGATDLMNPAENVRAGTRYLRYLSAQFDDRTLILAAYNAGEGTVRAYGGVPPYSETVNYVKKVEKARQRYQQRVAARIAQRER